MRRIASPAVRRWLGQSTATASKYDGFGRAGAIFFDAASRIVLQGGWAHFEEFFATKCLSGCLTGVLVKERLWQQLPEF
jgi:hypothetical protein